MTDIEIAQTHEMKPITEIAAAAGIDEQHLELYGKYKAKLDLTEIRKLPRKAKLILVTAISPTPAGEGKTTTSVGLADALNKIGNVKAGIIYYMLPVFSALEAHFVLKEHISLSQALGGAVVVAGVLLVSLPKKTPRRRTAPQ